MLLANAVDDDDDDDDDDERETISLFTVCTRENEGTGRHREGCLLSWSVESLPTPILRHFSPFFRHLLVSILSQFESRMCILFVDNSASRAHLFPNHAKL